MADKPNNPFQFWQELKRRKVIRVIPVYAAASFVLLELVDIIAEPLRLPDWTINFVLVLLCIGFIISIILSWVYDVTPEGVQKTKPISKVPEQQKEVPAKTIGWKIATYVSVAIIVGLIIFHTVGERKQTEDIMELEKSIAVLPFEDMSPQKDQEYFCDGMAEEIINALTHVEGLKVIARTSAFAFKGKQKDIREIGNILNVETLLEGSIRKDGNQLRITAQLIKVDDGSHLWSEAYNRDLESVFAIQDEISLAIVDNLKVKLLGEEKTVIEKNPTDNLEAYDLYLKGRYFWNKRNEKGLKEAIEYFSDAIEKDTNYALAYAGLADCYILVAFYGYVSSKDDIQNYFQKGKDAASKALDIDKALAEANASLAFVKLYHEWDWNGALKDFERAIQLNPSYETAHHWYSTYLSFFKRHDEAIAEVKHARELDPYSPIINRAVGRRLYFARKYDQAIEESLEALNITPDFYLTHRDLGLIYLQKGMFSEAILEMQKAVRYSEENLTQKAYLGYVYGVTGNQTKAQLILDTLIELSHKEYIPSLSIAIVYIGLGNNDNAISWLKKAYEEHSPGLMFLNASPIYDPLHSDPRFIDLLKKMGMEE